MTRTKIRQLTFALALLLAAVSLPQFSNAQQMHEKTVEKIELSPNKAFLGVLFNPEKSADNAIVLLDVVPNSTAADAGLQAGDQLVSIDGTAIKNHGSLKEALGGKNVGDKLSVVYLRNGEQMSGTAKMKAKPGETEWAKYEKKWLDGEAAEKHAEFEREHQARAKRGFLGIIADESPENAQGVLLGDVVEDSGAAKAGLQAGDVVTHLNGKAVSTLSDMLPVLKNALPGDEVALTYLRDGKTANTTAALGKMPQKYLDEHKFKHIEKRFSANSGRGFMGTIVKVEKEQTEDGEGNVAETVSGVTDKGIIVSDVVPESGAAKAGLQAGDVITHVNGRSVLPPEMFMEALDGTKPGDKVNVTYIRDGQTANRSVVLGEVPAEFAQKSCGSAAQAGCCAAKSACGSAAKSGCGEKGAANKALLGVYTEPVDATLAKKHGIKKVQGVYVEKVVPNSAAEDAGVQAGDVILKVNGDEVYSHNDLAAAVGRYQPGDAVKLKVKRNNKGKKMTATLKANAQGCKPGACCAKSGRAHGSSFEEAEEIENGGSIRVRIEMSEPTAGEKAMLDKALSSAAAKTATEDLSVSGLSFYPNPNNGQFTLNFETPEEGQASVRILDASGKVVYEDVLDELDGNYSKQIDVSGKKRGLYFLQVAQNGKTMTKKVSIQ